MSNSPDKKSRTEELLEQQLAEQKDSNDRANVIVGCLSGTLFMLVVGVPVLVNVRGDDLPLLMLIGFCIIWFIIVVIVNIRKNNKDNKK